MKNCKTRKYKVIALASLVLVAILCLSSCSGSSKAPDANGTVAGTDVKWKYTSSDATLEISGNGDIANFTSANDLPWADCIASAKVIEIEERGCLMEVTNTGNGNFYVGEKIIVNTNIKGCPKFAVGDHLRISFDGKVALSLPGQVLNVYSVVKTDANGNPQ